MRETTGFAYKHAVGVPQEELMEYQEPMFIEDILPAIQKHVIGNGDRTDFSLPPLAYTMERCSKERVVFLDVGFNEFDYKTETCPIMYFRWEVKMLPEDRKFESLDDIKRTFTKPMLFSIRADEMIVPNEGEVSLDEYVASYNRYYDEFNDRYYWARQFLDLIKIKNKEEEVIFQTRKKNGNLWLLNLIDKLTFAGNEKRSRIVFCCKAGSLPLVEDALIGRENVIMFDSAGFWGRRREVPPISRCYNNRLGKRDDHSAVLDAEKFDVDYVRKHSTIYEVRLRSNGTKKVSFFSLVDIGNKYDVRHAKKVPDTSMLRKLYCSFFSVQEMAFRRFGMPLEDCYFARPYNTNFIPVDIEVIKDGNRYTYAASYQGVEISKRTLVAGDESDYDNRRAGELYWNAMLWILFRSLEKAFEDPKTAEYCWQISQEHGKLKSNAEVTKKLRLFNAVGVCKGGAFTTNIPLSDEEEKLSYYKSVTFPRDDDYQRKDVAESFEDFYTVY